jgi:RNA polymerase sigma-70 factor (ECF subfamily)
MIASWLKSAVQAREDRRPLFEKLARESMRQAHAVALRLTGDAAEAEDLVQETYLRAFRFFHRYDDSLPFKSWLYRIMTNLHIDGVRRRRRLPTVSLSLERAEGARDWEIEDPDAACDRSLMAATLDEDLQFGLQSMNPEFRTAVVLADLEGLSYEEVASVMGSSVGTVRSRIHRGRRHLRDHLILRCPERFGQEGEREVR